MLDFLWSDFNRIKIIYIFFVFVFFWLVMQRPSNNRDWEVGQERLPEIIFIGDAVKINNYRNFLWRKDGTVEKRYETKIFKIDEINSVDVLISHFAKNEGLAHIFLSFGTVSGEHIVISVESRREIGEKFSPLLGLLRQFEIIYIVGSERDLIGLRTDVREGERVYLYPTVAPPEKAQALFREFAREINSLHLKPKIYNTLFRNCTNEITRKVETVTDLNFPFSWKTVMPGYFDEVLYEMKLIPHNKPFSEIKKEHLIDNGKVDYLADDYSEQLRKIIKRE